MAPLSRHRTEGTMNPDCRDGKHASCSGDGWNEKLDEPGACTCKCHECEICGVDHSWSMADLSHGIIRLMLHAWDRGLTWMEWPINGDMIARQRAGLLGNGLIFSFTDPEEIDWVRIGEQACICGTEAQERCTDDHSQNFCPYCRGLDIYDPCPRQGFGCGSVPDVECDCCTPDQRKAANS